MTVTELLTEVRRTTRLARITTRTGPTRRGNLAGYFEWCRVTPRTIVGGVVVRFVIPDRRRVGLTTAVVSGVGFAILRTALAAFGHLAVAIATGPATVIRTVGQRLTNFPFTTAVPTYVSQTILGTGLAGFRNFALTITTVGAAVGRTRRKAFNFVFATVVVAGLRPTIGAAGIARLIARTPSVPAAAAVLGASLAGFTGVTTVVPAGAGRAVS